MLHALLLTVHKHKTTHLDESVKYTLRDGETVVEDDMHAKDVVDTINNEYGKTMNV